MNTLESTQRWWRDEVAHLDALRDELTAGSDTPDYMWVDGNLIARDEPSSFEAPEGPGCTRWLDIVDPETELKFFYYQCLMDDDRRCPPGREYRLKSERLWAKMPERTVEVWGDELF